MPGDRERLTYRGRVVGELLHDQASGWWILCPCIGSPLFGLDRRWRSPEALRRAVQAACEDAEAREVAPHG